MKHQEWWVVSGGFRNHELRVRYLSARSGTHHTPPTTHHSFSLTTHHPPPTTPGSTRLRRSR